MAEETRAPSLVEEGVASASEERLAHLLQDLGARRGALREELGRIEEAIEQLEVELARRGAGG
jgi:hypothetical protein